MDITMFDSTHYFDNFEGSHQPERKVDVYKEYFLSDQENSVNFNPITP